MEENKEKLGQTCYYSHLPPPPLRSVPIEAAWKPETSEIYEETKLCPKSWHQTGCVKLLQLCLTLCDPMDCSPPPWAPLSMGFSRQEYWNGLPFPSPEDLPPAGIEPGSSALQADSFPAESPGKPISHWLTSSSCLPRSLFDRQQLQPCRQVQSCPVPPSSHSEDQGITSLRS